jgi:hypothetical protein
VGGSDLQQNRRVHWARVEQQARELHARNVGDRHGRDAARGNEGRVTEAEHDRVCAPDLDRLVEVVHARREGLVGMLGSKTTTFGPRSGCPADGLAAAAEPIASTRREATPAARISRPRPTERAIDEARSKAAFGGMSKNPLALGMKPRVRGGAKIPRLRERDAPKLQADRACKAVALAPC